MTIYQDYCSCKSTFLNQQFHLFCHLNLLLIGNRLCFANIRDRVVHLQHVYLNRFSCRKKARKHRGNCNSTFVSLLQLVLATKPKKYLVKLSSQILVQENDFVRAGVPLSDGAITPSDILSIKGPTAVQEYLVNEIQDVYRLQGVKINDKHIECIVRQMMQKVQILEPGDTQFLQGQNVDRFVFRHENDLILDQKVITDAGDSEKYKAGMILSARTLRDENSSLKRRDLKLMKVRDAQAAVSSSNLQGITQASLGTESFISAASFQETTKVLSEASIRAKQDTLDGLKENVIVGHLIPAGTGLRRYKDILVTSKDELRAIEAKKEAAEIAEAKEKVEAAN
mgnify:CR=1 FL=1